MFKNPFSFEGRIRRTEYGLSYLIYVFCIIVISFMSELGGIAPVFILGIIPLIWFLLAQGAKRCHDRGNTGWFQIIPFYGLWMLFADSDHGDNEYGPNPKGIGNMDEADQMGNSYIR
jgi:uncharacterized membrane protein YhaH (DUF805 family)